MLTLEFALNDRMVVHQTRLTLQEMSWAAVGGCEAARIIAHGTNDALWLWTTRLMSTLDVYAPDTARVWSGVLWSVSLRTPRGTFDYSLDRLCNRVAVEYSYATDGAVGARALTDWAEDAASVARYGVVEQLVSRDGLTPEMAEAFRDRYLAEYAWPRPTQDPGGRAEEVTCELTAFGHWARLQHQIYNDSAKGQLDTAAIAQLIIGGFAWASADDSQVVASGVTTTRHRSNSYTAQQELKNLQDAGNSVGQRVVAGIDADRRLCFRPVETSTRYYWKNNAPHNRNLQRLPGWYVQPGTWAEQVDVIAPLPLPDVAPPGKFFIERVTVTPNAESDALWAIEIEPADAQTLERLIVG